MVVPRLAKHFASLGTIAADSITAAMIDDKMDLVVASVTASTVTADLTGDVTGTADVAVLAEGVEFGHHTGILIADLQATFGDPAGLATGFTAVYKDDTTAKIYTVHVVGGAFYLHEAAAAAAA